MKGLGSIMFNGNNYLQVNNNGQFSTNYITICCWANIISYSGIHTIASCRNSNPFSGWMIYVNNNTIHFSTGGNNTWNGASNLYNIPISTWFHLAITISFNNTESYSILDNFLLNSS